MSITGDYYGDDYSQSDPLTSQYFSPQQIAMQKQLLSGGGAPGADYDPYQGMDPTTLMMIGGAAMPQLNTKGEAQPYDLGVQMQGTNFMQDLMSTVGNPMAAYWGGPGAYAPGALNQTYDEKPIEMTQGPQLDYLRQTGGVMGTLADLILGDPTRNIKGMNPIQAAARIRAMIETPDQFGVSADEVAQLQAELPAMTDQFGANTGPDWNAVQKTAMDLFTPYSKEQATLGQPGVTRLEDGRIVQRTPVDSPQMEFLKKLGLPDPRARYDLEFALKSDPTLSGLMSQSAGSQHERDLMRKEFEDRLKRIKKRREQGDADSQQMEKFKSATQQAMADYFASTGQRTNAVPRPSIGMNKTTANPADMQGIPGIGRSPGMGGEPGASVTRSPGLGGSPYWGAVGTDPTAALTDVVGPALLAPDDPLAWKGPPGQRGQGAFPGALKAMRLQDQRKNPATLQEMLPNRPSLGVQYSMMDRLLGKPQIDKRQAVLDAAVPEAMMRRLNMTNRRRLEGEGTEAAYQYAMKLAPIIAAGRSGKTPAGDVIQQRLNPLYAAGFLGRTG